MSDTDDRTTPGDRTCGEPQRDPRVLGALFPPRDADAATYRAWLAASPWPEVVFASAGAR